MVGEVLGDTEAQKPEEPDPRDRDRDDDTPDTPPTEMPPVPISDPPTDTEPPGPMISKRAG
jgi:hypothetical protein